MTARTKVSKGRGDKAKADRLFSLLVRDTGVCANCGYRCPCLPDEIRRTKTHRLECKLQCAHIIGRAYSTTRTDLDNAVCLDASCHMRFTDWPDEWLDFVGRDRYDALKLRANEGMGVKVDWSAELDRLMSLWGER